MRVTIEDLEALQELNDELEENHVETERALNEDIGELNSRKAPRHGTDHKPQNRRIPTFENWTRRPSRWKGPAKTWNIPLFGSVNWLYNCKRTVPFHTFPVDTPLTHWSAISIP